MTFLNIFQVTKAQNRQGCPQYFSWEAIIISKRFQFADGNLERWCHPLDPMEWIIFNYM